MWRQHIIVSNHLVSKRPVWFNFGNIKTVRVALVKFFDFPLVFQTRHSLVHFFGNKLKGQKSNLNIYFYIRHTYHGHPRGVFTKTGGCTTRCENFVSIPRIKVTATAIGDRSGLEKERGCSMKIVTWEHRKQTAVTMSIKKQTHLKVVKITSS